ncbi:SGNH/GDSL hydrolase family protein [Arthrobacter halodurans]|uniref:SGNH/GDSL hydrolase family protein n=1 Tax=Arthrobacter halodurans TaxID=516699 RepID=A0ABV4UK18_9MICC
MRTDRFTRGIVSQRPLRLRAPSILLLAVAAVFALVSCGPAAGPAATTTTTATTTASGSASDPDSASGAVTTAPGSGTGPGIAPGSDGEARALFIGDSYTEGWGAEPHERWTSVLSADMGWDEVNEGRAGTGYVNVPLGLPCGRVSCPAYPETVRALDADGYDVVVIAGGQNDFGAYYDPARREALFAGVRETYALAGERWPEARRIAVGPSTPREPDDAARAIDAAVREAAAETGAEYVSLLEPNVLTPALVLPDGTHVGPEGHRAIAERIREALR